MKKEMDNTYTENLIRVLVRQRDAAMSKNAELEAKLAAITQNLTQQQSKEQAEDLFKERIHKE